MDPVRTVRKVNPSVDHIASWISSVGASAAVADLDGDAYANEVCLVDPRSDSVSVHRIDRSTMGSSPVVTLLDENGIAPGAAGQRLAYDKDTQAPMGCRLADLDGNGWVDALVYFWGRGPVAYLNSGGMTFAPHEVLDGGADLDWYTNTAVFSDLNGDGIMDIFIGNYFADGAQLLDTGSPKRVDMNDSLSRAMNGGKNYVLLGRGGFPAVSYELVADAFSEDHSRGWTLAVAAADMNGDALPELYVANDFGPDRFFVNRSVDGELKFENVDGGNKGLLNPRSTMIGRDSFKGMGVTIADVDRDNEYDVYVSNITHEYGLFESQLLFLGDGVRDDGVPTFRPGAEALGLARTAFSWDNKVGDLDNDGRVELLQATGFVRGPVNRWPEIQELALSNDTLIANPRAWPDLRDADISGAAPRVVMTPTDDGRYANVAESSGLDDGGVMRGIALADIDGDGDLDWIEANQWADARLVVNDCDGCDGFVGLRILRSTEDASPTGPRTPQVIEGLRATHEVRGAAAMGATATVTTPSGSTFRSYVDGGNGHSGQSSTDVHFGLGDDAGDTHTVALTWRDATGTVQNAEVQVGRGWHTVVLP
ncbi:MULTISPECIES: CRTAC1 family protein [unclassified Micromonospora]|uniref:CRTAC1 family protein n=1 Tax=unclassified Micromonospora TaxID=2617518 RepID=UPI0013754FE7|nr:MULTISPECIES: CRTAC1 family protein [unclassified Micromonospora]QKW14625.1 CRTAC1 family protein [Verrucosispora sp. NA02020]